MKVKELKELLERMKDDDNVIISVRTYTRVYPVAYCAIWGYFIRHDTNELRLHITLPENMHTVEKRRKGS